MISRLRQMLILCAIALVQAILVGPGAEAVYRIGNTRGASLQNMANDLHELFGGYWGLVLALLVTVLLLVFKEGIFRQLEINKKNASNGKSWR